MADARYNFLSFVRTGFAAAITQPDTFGAGQPAIATAPVGVAVSGVAAPVTHAAVVRGPGDVIGLSRSQVVRTDPVDGAVGVEPNYFAQIEFDRPDLPWLFTPAAPVGQRLRPWLVLVVVDAEGAASCTLRPGSPLPVLNVPAAAAHTLPDLADSHLWAHAQAILSTGTKVTQAFQPGADPRLTVSRLLCPRHLSPNTWYTAAVVPAFEVGRLAGLGQAVTSADEAALAPAWRPGAAVDLPVYHSWRFRTGEDADFESLARRLQGRPLPEGVGTRPLDVAQPGAGLPALPTPADTHDTRAIVWLDGALRPIDPDGQPPRDAATAQAFQASLTVLLDRPADQVLAGNADPIVAPPIYGDKHALVVKLDAAAVPPWISELNLAPERRVAAGLGTQVVQARQEDYVARAWRQLGEVLAANRLLRAAQFARSGALRLHQRLATLAPPEMLALSYPAQHRVAGITATTTLDRAVRDSRLPDVAVEPAFRRLTRRSAAAGHAAATPSLGPGIVARFAAEVFTAPTGGPDGAVTMRPAAEVIGGTRATIVLTALGDAQPAEGARLDTVVSTLNASRAALPTAGALQAGAMRSDTGAVALLTSFGAAPAAAVSALLTASVAPAAPPPAPGPAGPGLPPRDRTGPNAPLPVGPRLGDAAVPHLAPGLAGQAARIGPAAPTSSGMAASGMAASAMAVTPGVPAAGLARATTLGSAGTATATTPGPGAARTPASEMRAGTSLEAAAGTGAGQAVRTGLVFDRGGPSRAVGGGILVRGGAVVLDNATVGGIAHATTAVQQIDEARWQAVQQTNPVLVANRTADPVSDVGTRLDAFRRDPAALTALAQVASGDLGAAIALDRDSATLATTGAAAAALAGLASGRFTAIAPRPAAQVAGADDLQAGRELLVAATSALDRMVLVGDGPPSPAAPAFDLAAAKSGLLARLDPTRTIAARIGPRLRIDVIAGVPRRDDLDPVMACPRFDDPMWQALRDLDAGWLLPGLSKVPPDTATLVRTNPDFVAGHLVGLNHEMMRELLWRDYPTDQRGTAFHRFWGRGSDDIGPVHLFAGALAQNLANHGQDEAVLLLRSELLRRYPGSIIYLSRATTDPQDQLLLDDQHPLLPSFRGDLPPDVSFIGFPITPDALRVTDQPWWFVIAQPPSEPRFGLDDWSSDTPSVPRAANDLAWSHMSADGHPDSPAPFAPGHAPILQGLTIDGVSWGDRAAAQAQLTYQHPVRVAIRATSLLPPPHGGTP